MNMNKELEKAIKHVFDRAKEMALMYEYDYPHITKKLEEDIKLVEQALKRNEPMKVDIRFFNNCPKCGETLRRCYNCCPICRQELDWSDDK